MLSNVWSHPGPKHQSRSSWICSVAFSPFFRALGYAEKYRNCRVGACFMLIMTLAFELGPYDMLHTFLNKGSGWSYQWQLCDQSLHPVQSQNQLCARVFCCRQLDCDSNSISFEISAEKRANEALFQGANGHSLQPHVDQVLSPKCEGFLRKSVITNFFSINICRGTFGSN